MTVRELIAKLSDVDEDVMDYEVHMIVGTQIGPEVRLTVRAKLERVPENVDVDAKRIWLTANKRVR